MVYASQLHDKLLLVKGQV